MPQATPLPYQPQRISQSLFVPLRGHLHHVRQWGQPRTDQAPLVMVHGWMDVAASYQFVVDALQQERWVLAPDWRGFGETTGPFCDHYVFADYLADLDFLLDHLVGERPIDLVGHSMGGKVAMALALQALVFVLGDEPRADRFLALTGLTPDALRAGVGDPVIMGAVLEFLANHEADLVAAAAALDIAPETLAAAWETLR